MAVCPFAQTGDGLDGPVVDRDVVELEVLLPPGELLLRLGPRRRGVCPVDKGDDVGVQRDHFADRAGGVGQGPEETKRLVGVLVAVAPGTPEDAGSPVFADARGGREDVAEAGGEDDLAGGEAGLLGGVGGGGGDDEVGIIGVAGGDFGDSAVDHGDGAVVGELLAGCPAEVGGGDAWVRGLGSVARGMREETSIPSNPRTSCMCLVGALRYTPESMRRTFRRTRASPLRAARPAGPPPTTTASKSGAVVV